MIKVTADFETMEITRFECGFRNYNIMNLFDDAYPKRFTHKQFLNLSSCTKSEDYVF